MTRYAAILSGGVGERFWPASTPERPKQLLPLLGRRTMLRETFERLAPAFSPEGVLVVTSRALVTAVRAECPEIPAAQVLGEPRPRNTAAAAGVAAVAALALGGEGAAVALLPADHAVADAAGFRGALERGLGVAAGGRIVTLGIRPDRPETGYGYITAGASLGTGAYEIAAFHEKPDPRRARELLEEGKSFWNAGMFVAPARLLVEEIHRHLPTLGALLAKLETAGGLPGRGSADAAFDTLFVEAPSISLDHGVMERTRAGAVVPAEFGWDDVGSWEAMARLVGSDAAGNVVRGEGRLAEARDNIVYAEDGRVTVIGASNLLVVRAGAETFVCARERLPEIRELLRRLNGSAAAASEPRAGRDA